MRWQLLQRTGGDSGPATPSARVPPVVVYEIVTCLLREAASGVVVAGGNSSTATPGGSHACRGAWMRAVALSGAAGRIQSPGACSRAATSCENQKICACRGLVASNGSLGNRPIAPGDWNHPPAPPRPVRQSAVRNANVPPAASGRSGVLTPSSGDAIQALVGRSVRLPREVRCEAQCAPCASLGRCAATQSAPASRPCLSWEAGWRHCAATATSYADGGAGALRGTRARPTVTVRWTPWKGPGPHEVNSITRRAAPEREGPCPQDRVLAARLRAHLIVFPLSVLLLSTACSSGCFGL